MQPRLLDREMVKSPWLRRRHLRKEVRSCVSWKKRSGHFRLPAASSLGLQATLSSSDGLIVPQAQGAHNCANSFDFIAEFEMVAAGSDSSCRHPTALPAQFASTEAEATALPFTSASVEAPPLDLEVVDMEIPRCRAPNFDGLFPASPTTGEPVLILASQRIQNLLS